MCRPGSVRGLTAALTACGGEDPDAGTNGVGKLPAGRRSRRKARTAADAADAVRLSGTLVSKGGTYKLDMRLKDDGGTGLASPRRAAPSSCCGSARQLYLKADAGFWSHEDGKGGATARRTRPAADKLDDKYVKVPARATPRTSSSAASRTRTSCSTACSTLHGKLDNGRPRARSAASAPSRSPAARATAARSTSPWRARRTRCGSRAAAARARSRSRTGARTSRLEGAGARTRPWTTAQAAARRR